jgi:putative transposase
VKYAFIEAQEVAFPVQAMCQVLGVSRSGYYDWKERPEPAVDAEAVALSAEITAAHKRSRGTYGSPRVHRELRAKGTLNRDFDPPAADRAWAGDVTYIATDEGWLYLAVMLDLFSRRIVGWSVSSTNDTALAAEALRRALVARRPEAGLLHHTDRGSPYAALAYSAILRQYGVVASMSRSGDCYDNAVVESFFGTLKAELVRECVYPSRVVATAAIRDYIENFYNSQRRHSHLQYLSPIEFELRSQTAAFAA